MIRLQPPHRGIAIVALQQIALATVLSILVAGWLHIPDANAFQVLASIVVALGIAAVFGAAESAIALRLTNRPANARQLLLGTLAVCFAALLWYGISLGVDHSSAKDSLRAGYINSRFPARLRNLFSYEHLLLWFGWLGSALRWVAAGLLAAAAFASVTSSTPRRGMLAIVRSRAYWLSFLLLVLAGAVVAPTLLTWTPGHGLPVELLSVILRVLTVVLLLAAAIAWLLQTMARSILRLHSVGTAEPARSQPRTAEMP